MRCVMVMFDSLNRHFLPCYGNRWVHAPNFERLARRAVTFDTSYVCSMPCMPARRDLHTARPNFLHRGWGPIEPFDDSVPAMLSSAGVQTHLATDHYHYFEDGGCTYHTRYNTWEFFRGQEGDPWIGQVAEPHIPANINGKGRRQDWVNRMHVRAEMDFSQPRTFAAGLRYIDRNAEHDNWFLTIECFDPHEPFVSSRRWRDLYPREYDGPLFDWPGYREVRESPEQIEEVRRNYAALLSLCDASLGDVLDAFDRLDLWKDTMLVVWTDHGFLLGEHQCWAKNWMPLYEEIAHTPLFIWDPRQSQAAGQRRRSLVQPAIDLGPTLLRFFGAEPTERMLGKDLAPVIVSDSPVREAAIFGYHNSRVNVTDGRHVYLRDVVGDRGAAEYTLMPTRMRGFIDAGRDVQVELVPPLGFTKGQPLVRYSKPASPRKGTPRHLLFDVQVDPRQEHPLDYPALERRMCGLMSGLMRECEAPQEQFERLGLA